MSSLSFIRIGRNGGEASSSTPPKDAKAGSSSKAAAPSPKPFTLKDYLKNVTPQNVCYKLQTIDLKITDLRDHDRSEKADKIEEIVKSEFFPLLVTDTYPNYETYKDRNEKVTNLTQLEKEREAIEIEHRKLKGDQALLEKEGSELVEKNAIAELEQRKLGKKQKISKLVQQKKEIEKTISELRCEMGDRDLRVYWLYIAYLKDGKNHPEYFKIAQKLYHKQIGIVTQINIEDLKNQANELHECRDFDWEKDAEEFRIRGIAAQKVFKNFRMISCVDKFREVRRIKNSGQGKNIIVRGEASSSKPEEVKTIKLDQGESRSTSTQSDQDKELSSSPKSSLLPKLNFDDGQSSSRKRRSSSPKNVGFQGEASSSQPDQDKELSSSPKSSLRNLHLEERQSISLSLLSKRRSSSPKGGMIDALIDNLDQTNERKTYQPSGSRPASPSKKRFRDKGKEKSAEELSTGDVTLKQTQNEETKKEGYLNIPPFVASKKGKDKGKDKNKDKKISDMCAEAVSTGGIMPKQIQGEKTKKGNSLREGIIRRLPVSKLGKNENETSKIENPSKKDEKGHTIG